MSSKLFDRIDILPERFDIESSDFGTGFVVIRMSNANIISALNASHGVSWKLESYFNKIWDQHRFFFDKKYILKCL